MVAASIVPQISLTRPIIELDCVELDRTLRVITLSCV